ncbi:MAG: DUF1844 domain-containing protein [Candidatus Marinimicrobia bacterium]|nr:DUF1844 domain-containing protein [Candidatus Neomarinimicrobiota bacterium]
MSNQQTGTPPQDLDPRFAGLLQMLTMMAVQHLGRIPDPESGQPTVNLEAAQAMIDLIEGLEAKTTGNLSATEARALAETLTALRMDFVQQRRTAAPAAADAPQSAPAPEAPPAPTATDAPQSAPAPDKEPAPQPAETDRVRYHKSYG